MTQEEFNEIVNAAAIHTSEDNSNDFYTILEEMIEDEEEEMIEDKMENIGEGLVKQVNEVHEYPLTTKEDIRKALMSISTEEYEEIWKRAFGESYKEFVDKLLDN